MRINLVSGPSVEPITVSDAHIQCGLDTAITLYDATYLPRLITAARENCEQAIHQKFITQTVDIFLDDWGQGFPGNGFYFWGNITGATQYNQLYANQIVLPHEPVQSITWVKYVDQTGTLVEWDTDQYTVSLGKDARISPVNGVSFPTLGNTIDCVQIRYVAGYGDDASSVPASAQHAILLWVAHLFRNRLAVEDVVLSEIPLGVADLLRGISSGKNLFA